MDNSIAFLLGLTAGVTIGLLIANKKPTTPDNEDPDGSVKQAIYDKLEKLNSDIKSTV